MTTSIRWPADRLAASDAPPPVDVPDPSAAPVDVPVVRLPAGKIDYPDSGSMVPRSVLSVQGWAMFPSGPPDRVELSLDGKDIGRAQLCCAREDIREATGIEATSVSGFSFEVELWALDQSVERAVIAARAVGPDGETMPLNPVEVWLSPPDAPGANATFGRARRRGVPGPGPKHVELLVAAGRSSDPSLPALVALLGQVAAEHAVRGVVLSTDDNPALTRLADAGFDVHLTGQIPVDSPRGYEDRLDELSAWASRERFDAALIDTLGAFPGGDLAVRLGVPAVWAIHASLPLPSQWEMMHSEAAPYVRRQAESALRASAAAVFDAEETRRLFAPDLPGVPCLTVPHGVDIVELNRTRNSVDRDAARARRGIPSGATVVLCTGRFSAPEEQAAVVWAFARVADRHPDAVLIITDALGAADSAAAELAVSACGLSGDRIRIEPEFADLPEHYAIADLFVCAPDWTWLPGSILEAMAVGLPVLATAVLGVPQLIEDGVTGWLAERGDLGALTFTLNRVLRLTQSERAGVGKAARARVHAEHDTSKSARAWADVLRRTAAGRPIDPFALASLRRRDPA